MVKCLYRYFFLFQGNLSTAAFWQRCYFCKLSVRESLIMLQQLASLVSLPLFLLAPYCYYLASPFLLRDAQWCAWLANKVRTKPSSQTMQLCTTLPHSFSLSRSRSLSFFLPAPLPICISSLIMQIMRDSKFFSVSQSLLSNCQLSHTHTHLVTLKNLLVFSFRVWLRLICLRGASSASALITWAVAGLCSVFGACSESVRGLSSPSS